jgi:asparagine synthase (glutamine-hydrolysing)
MCGICGVVGADGAVVAKRVRKMMNALVHRGPDGEGILDRPGAVFGIRRLSIIDLSSGQQPMYNETGDVGVVFNGEIYNFPQLRATLESRSHRFHTRCDTEIIVHAYEEWGDRCVEHLDGMFSFALWDGRNSGGSLSGSHPKKGRVLLARDRLGIKPLYYALATGVLIFASELRALLASEAVERRLAPQSIEAYLLFGSVVEPMTLVEGVYSLPAGHSLALNLDAPMDPSPTAYWELSFRANQKVRQAPRALAPAGHGVRALLEKAVASQLLADVPVGVFLSSGLDSTAVAALAARERAGIQTFTMSFLEQDFDEASWARNTARQLGTKHHELLLTGEEMQTRLFEAIGALDQPSMDGVNTFFLSWGARRAGLKVALSGLGGDELFGGYPSFRVTPQLAKIVAIAGRLPERARHAISLALLEIGRRAGVRERADRLRKIASVFSHPEALPHAYFLNRILFTPRQTERLLSPSIIAMRSEAAHSERISWRKWLEQLVVYAGTLRGESVISYLELRTYMLNTLLRDTDSMSMHHSLEVRVPLLDHELVEYVEALPNSARKKAGTVKALLAESVKDLLPGGAEHRPKRAFTLPWEHWLRGKAGTEVACRLDMLTPSLASMLDSNAVQSVWRRFLSKRTGWARPWSLFVLNEWARKHIDEVESNTKLTERPAAEAAAS